MQCPHCNQEHPDGIRFCPLTGREIMVPATCPNCGKIAEPNWLYCNHCGQNLRPAERKHNQQGVPVADDSLAPMPMPGSLVSRARSQKTPWLMIAVGIGGLIILGGGLITLGSAAFKGFLSGPSVEQIPTITTMARENTPTLTSTPAPTKIPTLTVSLPTVSADDISLILHDEPLVNECPIAQASTSIVWVEPGPEEGMIAVLSKIPSEYLQVLGLSAPPDLELVIIPVLTTGGFKGQSPFSFGTKFYGAVTGPVRIAGQDRRNMKGAIVVAKRLDGSILSENDIIFGPNPVDCLTVIFDLNPPFLEAKP